MGQSIYLHYITLCPTSTIYWILVKILIINVYHRVTYFIRLNNKKHSKYYCNILMYESYIRISEMSFEFRRLESVIFTTIIDWSNKTEVLITIYDDIIE